MRKLLMAATAVAGAVALSTGAHAQQTGMMAGIGGDPTIFGPTSSVPGPTGLPGSINFYFKGRLHTDWMIGGDSLDRGGGNKSQQILFGEYARLYTGFAGVAANGLNFGAYIEVRQNGSSALGASTGTATLIFRREAGYLKGNWGQVRFGETDGASGLFMTGTFENYDDGAWNGDLPVLFSGNAEINWPFPENSGTYGTGKIVYLSPQFAGFDFGLDYEPNQDGTNESTCSSALASGAGAGCQRLTTITGPAFLQKRVNTFDGVGRYQGTFGPVAFTGTLGAIESGHVNNLASPGSDMFVYEAGATAAIGGFAFGGNYLGGSSTAGTLTPLNKGAPHQQSFIVGTSYAFGPFIVGASYIDENSAGAWNGGTIKGSLHEIGISAGGTYAWAPGTSAFLSFLYGHRHQIGYDFATGAAGTASNNTSAIGMLVGNTFNW